MNIIKQSQALPKKNNNRNYGFTYYKKNQQDIIECAIYINFFLKQKVIITTLPFVK